MCGQTCCLQLVGVNGYLKWESNTADIDHVHHQARGFIDRDFDFGFFGVTKSSVRHFIWVAVLCKAFVGYLYKLNGKLITSVLMSLGCYYYETD